MTGFVGCDPLVRKELCGASRRWQTYAGRGFYVGLIAVAVFRFWREVNHPGVMLSLSDYAHLGRRLFDMFLPLQMVFVGLSAVSGASDTVAREARAGTLGLLLLTSLDPRRIAAGKWLAVMVQALSLVLCGLPVLAICAYLGGIGAWEVLWSALLTLATASIAAALAIAFSATSPSGARAMFVTLGTFAGVSVGPAIVALFGTPGLGLASFLHPAIAAATAANALTLGEPFRYTWIPALLVSTLLTRRLLRAAALRIGRRAQLHARPASSAPRDFATARSYFGPKREGRRRIVVHAGVWERYPLLWKELATRAAARMGADLRAGIVFLFFIFMILFVMVAGNIVSVLAPVGLTALILALVNGAGLFVHEKEGRKIDLLLSTPLTAWGIVRTKLAAGVLAPESLGVLGLGLLFLLGWSSEATLPETAILVTSVSLALGFAYVLAATASLYARTLRGAFLVAAGTVTLLYFGAPWLGDLLFQSRSDAALGAATRVLSPASTVETLWGLGPWRRGDRIEALRGIFLPQVALYAVLIALLAAGLVARLKRVAGTR